MQWTWQRGAPNVYAEPLDLPIKAKWRFAGGPSRLSQASSWPFEGLGATFPACSKPTAPPPTDADRTAVCWNSRTIR